MNEIFIKIEGLNLYRIIQKLVDGGVLISNLNLKKTHMIFSINKKYFEKLKTICKKEKKKIYIVKKTKIKRFFARIPYLLGCFIPFLILFAFFYATNNIIFGINISCQSGKEYDINKVSKILLKHNLNIGSKKSDFNLKMIEEMILKNSEDISGCQVFYEGQKLNIVVYPAVIKHENSDKDLLSKYNAIITRIDAFVGDKNVAVGDLVKSGDILIKNNQGAKGEIFGRVYFSATHIYNEKRDILKETGNVFYSYEYSFANIIKFSKSQNCNFDNYIMQNYDQTVVKNLIIPIVKRNYVYKEVAIVQEIIPFSEVENEIKTNLKSEVLSQLPAEANAENITYSVVNEGGYTRVDCFVEVEISLI